MDSRLQQLSQLIQQAIDEATKTVREHEREEKRRQEFGKLIAKLKGEIVTEQLQLNAEKKKAAAMATRNRRLDRDMQTWQQKLDDYELQAKQLKSNYLGKMGADVDMDLVPSNGSPLLPALSIVHTSSDPKKLLPFDVPEHECVMWSVDSSLKSCYRDPTTLPVMDVLICSSSRNGSPNGKKGRKSSKGRKRTNSSNGSDLEASPKKRVGRKRIVDADGTVAKLSSEFKRECLVLLTAHDALSNAVDEDVKPAATIRDWADMEELALIAAPGTGRPVDLRCASHTFRPESIVTVSRRFNQKDFEAKMNQIKSCPNLRILCMFDMDSRYEKLAVSGFYPSLAEKCPKIEHFIVSDGCLDIAIGYQENLPDNIRVVEIKNSADSEDEVIHLIKSCPKIDSVFLKHSSELLIREIVPQVKTLSLCWITDLELKSLVKCSRQSNISELMLETVHLTMDPGRIEQLALALPHLQMLKLSAPLEHIHCLSKFKCLTRLIFDAESQHSIDPDFPVDIKRALELTRSHDEEEDGTVKEEENEEGLSRNSYSCQIGLEKFFAACGSTLTSLSLTLRERSKKNFFQLLKRGCPVLKELTILSTTEQYFEPKSLSLPTLQRLTLQFICLNDSKLVDVLDHCRNLTFVSIDKPRKVTSAIIRVFHFYGQDVASNRKVTAEGEKFTAIVLTEGKEQLSHHIVTQTFDITFEQKAVAEISNRLRYKF